MCAEPSPDFYFRIGNVNFVIEKHDTEMLPGINAQVVTIDYEISKTASGAGTIIR